MKYLRKFNSVSEMNTAIASATIGMIGLAYDNGTPVIGKTTGSSPVPPTPSTSTPFYVENITNSNETLTIAGYGDEEYLEIQVEKSTDGSTWTSFGTTGVTPLTQTLTPGDKVYLRASTNTWFDDENIGAGCSISGVSKVGGNIMSLIYGSGFTGNETTFPNGSTFNFGKLFAENTNLVNASQLILPATTLTEYCYDQMFDSCTSLTTAPALPATTLTDYCYYGMFYDCTSLTTAPVLPATTLAEACYYWMFRGCTALTSVPTTLPATTLASQCYTSMFEGCTSLTTTPTLPATTLAWICYSNMFLNCTSLTLNDIPTLSATTLASNCYSNMFYCDNGTGISMNDTEYNTWCSENIPAAANYNAITHGRLFASHAAQHI